MSAFGTLMNFWVQKSKAVIEYFHSWAIPLIWELSFFSKNYLNKTQSYELRQYILHIVPTNVMYYHCAAVGNGWSAFMTIWILVHTLNFILRLLFHDNSGSGSSSSRSSSSYKIYNLWQLIYPVRFTHVSDV
jgi:hypothetical protein